VSRKAGKGQDANRLIQMLVERNPTDTTTLLLWAESLLLDRKDPTAALAALDSITVRPDDAADASAARHAGRGCPPTGRSCRQRRVVLQALATQFPATRGSRRSWIR
jgi:hypothetical protein